MRIGLGLLVFAALVSIGCGRAPDRVGVTGQVVFEDGQPVDHGMIEFAPIETQNAVGAGAVILSGSYKVPRAKGLRLGRYRVRIYQADRIAQQAGPPGSVPVERPKEQIAAKFNSETELTAEIGVLEDQRLDYRVQHR